MTRLALIAALALALAGCAEDDSPTPSVTTPDDLCSLAIALCGPTDAFTHCASDIQWCLEEGVSPADREWWEAEAPECMETTFCLAVTMCIDSMPVCGWHPGEGLQ